MLTSTTPARAATVLSTVMLLALAAGCGDDGDGDDREPPGPPDGTAASPGSTTLPADDESPGEDVDLPAGTEQAVLSAVDVDGWEPDVTVAEDLAFESCPDHPEEWNAIEGAVSIEFSPADGPTADLNGVFQEIVTFPDEDAAGAYASLLATSLSERAASDCPSVTDPDPDAERVGFEIEEESPLDLGQAELGEHAAGEELVFEPFAREEAIISMESVTFQKGNVVVTVALFLPLASDLDVVELASVSYDRLPG